MPPRKKAEPEPEVDETPTAEPEPEPEPEPKSPPDETPVTVPFGDNPGDTATLLIAAAEETGAGRFAVRTGTGVFYVPAHIAEKAGVEVKKDD